MAEPTGLKVYVMKSGKTQQEIADELNLGRVTINKWLNNDWKPIDDIVKLLVACGLTLETIADIPLGDLFGIGEVAQ